jgi:hypothetical protein
VRSATSSSGGSALGGFIESLEEKNKRVDILSVMEERGLPDVVEVQSNKVRLTEPPEDLRVVGRAGLRRRQQEAHRDRHRGASRLVGAVGA